MAARASAPAPPARVNHSQPLIKLLCPPCLLPTRARSPPICPRPCVCASLQSHTLATISLFHFCMMCMMCTCETHLTRLATKYFRVESAPKGFFIIKKTQLLLCPSNLTYRNIYCAGRRKEQITICICK